MRIAVLGLGRMGSAIATRLLDAGHDLRVWNRTPNRGEQLLSRGAARASSPFDAVRESEIAIMSLTNDDAVRAVVVGEAGVARGLANDALLADMSTVSPETSRELAGEVGGRFVDAPILGGPAAVLNHQATILLGGDGNHIDRLVPLADIIGVRHFRCGPVGSAGTVKIFANLLLIGQLAVLAEAIAAAQARGIDNGLLEKVASLALVPPALQNRLHDVIRGDHAGWFSLLLGRKDVHLARSLGSGADLDMLVTAAVETLCDRAIEAGLGDRDIAAIVEGVRSPGRRARAG
jgi:3-hydroxyisobutyrate dehydrogenase-like beta-hydroxyacid dehydrogenase